MVGVPDVSFGIRLPEVSVVIVIVSDELDSLPAPPTAVTKKS
jgi:hypothetical protein